MADSLFQGVIDVYEQNDLDFDVAAAQGVRAIFHRVSIGLREDARYRARRDQALAKGFLWGAFHLPDASDPERQLEFMLSIEDGSNPQIAMAIDWEDSGHGALSYQGIRSMVSSFNQRMKPAYPDRYPILYGSQLIRGTNGIQSGDSLLAKCPLWIAEYSNVLKPLPVATWPNYTLWQFDDEKREFGAPAKDILPGVDWNRFNGSRADFEAAWPF